jgi:hypothetical protein
MSAFETLDKARRCPDRDFREKVELRLARKRVAREVAGSTLGANFERTHSALKPAALLAECVGAGYIGRNRPLAHRHPCVESRIIAFPRGC